MLVPLWMEWLKKGALSPEKLVNVGTTVDGMFKERCLSPEKLVNVGTTVGEMVKERCSKS